MSEDYVKVEELLSEVKTRILSVPCPDCGGLPEEIVKPGTSVKCKYCKTIYCIENSLNQTSHEALRNIVNSIVSDAIGRFDINTEANAKELYILQEYAKEVIKETRTLHDVLGRLPSREELDTKLLEPTKNILETIASSSARLLNGQENISVKVDKVTGGIDSIRISMTEVKKLLQRIEGTYSKNWQNTKEKQKATLLYQDIQDKTRELAFKDIIIGRLNRCELVAIFPDNDDEIQNLWLTDPTVSRKHARITATDDDIIIVDLASKNGTYLNNRKIPSSTPTKVRSEDEIRIGVNTKFFASISKQRNASNEGNRRKEYA